MTWARCWAWFWPDKTPIELHPRGRPRTLTNAPPEEEEDDGDDYDEEAQRTDIWYGLVHRSSLLNLKINICPNSSIQYVYLKLLRN